jgi:acetoin utilization protein AcuB
MRDKDIGALPVLDNGALVGIITETDIFDAFLEILGFRSRGTRLSVEIDQDRPGILADIAAIIADLGMNVVSVAVFRNEIIFKINTLNTVELVGLISGKGYRILSVLTYD